MVTIREWGPTDSPPLYRLVRIDRGTVRIIRLRDDGREVEGVSILAAFAPALADTLQRLSDAP
jgi:hypothetical protein